LGAQEDNTLGCIRRMLLKDNIKFNHTMVDKKKKTIEAIIATCCST
jgi:hypothetical protein